MSVRSRYSNDTLDEIFCYFMRTILHFQETGIEKLPLENNLPEPVKSYMDIAMELMIGGQPPEPSQIILESEYAVLLHQGKLDVETVMCLQVIKELSCHIQFDKDQYGYLLSLRNLWGNRTMGYAAVTFYPNLPAEIRQKYQIDELIKYTPREMFRLDDY